MTPRILVLDTTPLGLVTQRPGKPHADSCRAWVRQMLTAGHTILVPEIADYEIRRELVRNQNAAGVNRLSIFNTAEPGRYLPLTTDAMRLAADLWAQLRNAGQPTADVQSIDGDVILAAQVLAAGFPAGQIIVATSNVRHISRLLPADVWTNIHP